MPVEAPVTTTVIGDSRSDIAGYGKLCGHIAAQDSRDVRDKRDMDRMDIHLVSLIPLVSPITRSVRAESTTAA
jgi:hypothetical protein